MRIPAILLISVGVAWADKANPTDSEIQSIIKQFSEKESAFAQARGNYTYRQTAKLLETGGGGKWEEVSDVIFTPSGRREEKVIKAPMTTLRQIIMTPEDLKDIRDTQPFVLTSKDIDQYYVRFLGKESLDDINCYVFAVKPKKLESNKRYFSGMIYVDDQDLQIVKSYGRGVGIAKGQKFPKFETFREQIDGKYWFPTYTVSNDTLYFDAGPVPIKMTVKYENYKQFKSDVNIKFGDVVEPTASASGGSTAAPVAGGAPATTTTTTSSSDENLPPHMRQKSTSTSTTTSEAPISTGPELAPPLARPAKKKKN